MDDKKKFTYEFKLTRGSVVNINGVPYEYLGNGVFGGNTSPARFPTEGGPHAQVQEGNHRRDP